MTDGKIKISEKHSRILRLSHWLNAVFLSLMIWSGVLIYWANPAYVSIPNKLGPWELHHRLAEGMGWHFLIMWPFFINGLVYFAYLLISGEWRLRLPDRQTFREAFKVILHELKLIKDAPAIRGKYNAAQRVAYTMAIVMGLGTLITGIAIYKPVQVGWLTELLGGYEAARFEHFLLMICFMLFLFVHVIQVVRAGWNNFRSMIAGYEIEKD